MKAEPRAGLAFPAGWSYGGRAARVGGMCLLLGAAGAGKSLLVKRLQTILPAGRGAPGGGGRPRVGAVVGDARGGRGGRRGTLRRRSVAGEGTWGVGAARAESRPRRPRRPLRPRCPVWVLDRLAQLSSQDGKGDLGDPPPTRPTVGVALPHVR